VVVAIFLGLVVAIGLTELLAIVGRTAQKIAKMAVVAENCCIVTRLG
jgi:hypothetical protein